jgi:hypothetical protein
MREAQIDHPAVLGPLSRQGLGWWLHGGLVGHGGGSTGVSASLQTAPRHDFAAVVLTNSEDGTRLIGELLEPILTKVAGAAPSGRRTTPVDPAVTDPRPYVGHFASRQNRFEIDVDEDGELRLTQTPQHESLTFAARGGVSIQAGQHRLRPADDDIFRTVDADEPSTSGQAMQFLGRDHHDRARFLFTGGRAIPRLH